MAGFDLETTGVDVETARIVTACVGLATKQGWSARNWLLRQDEPIPAEATEIHGITTEYANQCGTDPASSLPEIRDDLYKAWQLGMPVVAYNAVFDLTILDRELRRHNLGGLDIRGPVLDPLVIDKALDRYRKGSRKLIDTCTYYGVALSADDAHGAEADARAAARLAWRLAGKPWRGTTGRGQFMAMCGTPLRELHAWQAEQYRQQRESFAAYLASRDEQLDDPSTDWPLRPVPNPATTTASRRGAA
jgi:DNA polymerase-3 subunit epsilon